MMPRLAVLLLGGAVLAFPQGMAVPRREPRSSPHARVDRPLPEVHFEDIAAPAGLKFTHVSGDPVLKQFLVESTGSGVALFDYDNDGLLDVFLVNGTRWKPPFDATSHLFRNLGNLRLQDVSARAGFTKTGWGQGVCAGDYDNDGFTDLYVTYWGHDTLYRNQHDGTFRDVTAAAGLGSTPTRWGAGCAFLDYDRDGHLDLAVANYARLDLASTPRPGANPLCRYKGLPVPCGPRGLPGGSNLLFRNLGNGKFADVTAASGFSKPSGYYGFSVVTGDYDNDGFADVYIACDSTPSILYRNNGDGSFTDVGVSSGAAFNQDGEEQAGMGAAADDYLHSGRLHIVKTNFSGDTPTLYQNDGAGFFTDLTMRAGLAVHTRFLGWGVGFLDADNDGWKDIFIVNGHVYPNADRLRDASPYRQQRNLYWNLGNGAFADISQSSGPAVLQRHSSRGAAFGDLDNNGAVDIVINNLDESPSLLVNRSPPGNWLIVRLLTGDPPRDAIGARLTLRTASFEQMSEIRSGSSYLSHNDLRLHFGLGPAASYEEIRVRWPDGALQRFPAGPANRLLTLRQQR